MVPEPDKHGNKPMPLNTTWKKVAFGAGGLVSLALIRRVLFPPVEMRLHVAGPDGFVAADPAGLARAAGVPLEVYVLASMMQSEESSNKGRLAVGRTAWNATKHDSSKIVDKLLPNGRLGLNPFASTAQPPTSLTLDLAGKILSGKVVDFVEGAIQWDAPALQDLNHARYLSNPRAHPRYKHSSADIARNRVAAGGREVRVPGVPATRFWTYV